MGAVCSLGWSSLTYWRCLPNRYCLVYLGGGDREWSRCTRVRHHCCRRRYVPSRFSVDVSPYEGWVYSGALVELAPLRLFLCVF